MLSRCLWVGLPLFLFFLVGFLGGVDAFAEPWISTRFAQNCSGCHAPGRKNVEASQRRCTLSCQGCHVNPNGGGLRSFYGKWNEERWLKSFNTGLFAEAKAPLPYKRQTYAGSQKLDTRTPSKEAAPAPTPTPVAPPTVMTGKKIAPPEREIPFDPETLRKLHGVAPALLTTPATGLNEAAFDRRDGLEKIVVEDYNEFLAQIPREDPFYLTRLAKVDGGADIRWQMLQSDSSYSSETSPEIIKSKRWASFLMSADLGLRWRPVHERYHLVYEGRYFGSPAKNKKAEDAAATLNRRSLYVLVDDLPYATYAMAGYYRPLFGHYSQDHTALAQRVVSNALQESSAAYNIAYQAATVGGSPNVPFANVHYLGKQLGAKVNTSHSGFALNLGGRFVTLGSAFSYSLWQSSKKERSDAGDVTTKLQMHAITAGLQVWRITSTMELLSVAKDIPNDAFLKTFVASVDTYTRLWRELYFNAQFSQANTAVDLRPGITTQVRLGVRAFWVSGVETMVHYGFEKVIRNHTADQEESELLDDTLTWQMHLYI